jgi:ADP-ribosylglycohydrolase
VAVIAPLGVLPEQNDGWEGISPFVTGSVLWSLYAFFRSPADYWTTMRTSIAVGGDVDTTAAMAGAISGACLGLERLPLRLAAKVHDRGTWGYAELVELAELCHALRHPHG